MRLEDLIDMEWQTMEDPGFEVTKWEFDEGYNGEADTGAFVHANGQTFWEFVTSIVNLWVCWVGH